MIQIGKFMKRLFFDVQAPVADLMHVSADPPKNLPVISLLRIDNDGNLPLPAHGRISEKIGELAKGRCSK
jgi:hypothetical protein